ncbi:restriction endonuclease subunit S [Bacillus spizizenii]|nr:restriction endonuclease subunit S [Bacillus spizizenii]
MGNKRAPEVRFPEFSGDWEERKLSHLMEFSNGINAPKENYGKGRKMVSVMDILDDEPIIYKNIRNSVEVDDKTESKNKVENGDLVFVRSSEIRDEVGWAKAYQQEEYALYSGFSIRGKKKSNFDAKFIELTLNNANREQIERKAGGSTRFNVSQSILESIVILEPTINEQIALGDFFKQLDDTIALHQQELTILKQTKQGFLQKMFPKEGESVPEVRFPGFTGEWEERKVKDFSEETFGGGTPKTSIKEYWNGEIPWIQSSDLEEHQVSGIFARKKITEKGLRNSATKLIPKNSIAIVTRVGVGKIALIQFEYATSQDFLSLSNLKVNEWFGVYSLYNQFQKELHNVQGTSIKGITKNELLEKKINIPTDLKEQTKIGVFFKKLDNTIALHQRELDALKETKKAFLQKMFV